MADMLIDVTACIHDSEIPLYVTGRWDAGDPSVGEPAGLADPVLCWLDETPLPTELILLIGPEQCQRIIDGAQDKAREQGPWKPDPDYLRDMRADP